MYQLIYTSAPRLLEAGKTGFGTVARSRAIPQPLVTYLERMSGFDRGAGADSLLVYTCYKLGGLVYHTFSRIGDCGVDYTRRTNHLAHHWIILEDESTHYILQETTPVGILKALQGTWITNWKDAPHWFDNETALPSLFPDNTRCWEQFTGNQDNQRWLNQQGVEDGCNLMLPANCSEQDTLNLLHEALLQRPDHGWGIGFSTAYTSILNRTVCPLFCISKNQINAGRIPTEGYVNIEISVGMVSPPEEEIIPDIPQQIPDIAMTTPPVFQQSIPIGVPPSSPSPIQDFHLPQPPAPEVQTPVFKKKRNKNKATTTNIIIGFGVVATILGGFIWNALTTPEPNQQESPNQPQTNTPEPPPTKQTEQKTPPTGDESLLIPSNEKKPTELPDKSGSQSPASPETPATAPTEPEQKATTPEQPAASTEANITQNKTSSEQAQPEQATGAGASPEEKQPQAQPPAVEKTINEPKPEPAQEPAPEPISRDKSFIINMCDVIKHNIEVEVVFPQEHSKFNIKLSKIEITRNLLNQHDEFIRNCSFPIHLNSKELNPSCKLDTWEATEQNTKDIASEEFKKFNNAQEELNKAEQRIISAKKERNRLGKEYRKLQKKFKPKKNTLEEYDNLIKSTDNKKEKEQFENERKTLALKEKLKAAKNELITAENALPPYKNNRNAAEDQLESKIEEQYLKHCNIHFHYTMPEDLNVPNIIEISCEIKHSPQH